MSFALFGRSLDRDCDDPSVSLRVFNGALGSFFVVFVHTISPKLSSHIHAISSKFGRSFASLRFSWGRRPISTGHVGRIGSFLSSYCCRPLCVGKPFPSGSMIDLFLLLAASRERTAVATSEP